MFYCYFVWICTVCEIVNDVYWNVLDSLIHKYDAKSVVSSNYLFIGGTIIR